MYTILHTNDFHARLSLQNAERLRIMRTNLGSRGLLLDAGDAISSGNITFRRSGEPILKQMSAIGYDAMTVGNREFHFTRTGFYSKLKLAEFAVLCANVYRSNMHSKDNSDEIESSSLPVRPFRLFDDLQNKKRILVFGVTEPMITSQMLSRKISAYLFADPIQTSKALMAYCIQRFQPHLVVALTHIGLQRDKELARSVPGIDLIIGGHSHSALPEGEVVGDTLIVQAGCYAQFVGRVDVDWTDPKTDRPRLTASLESL